MRTRPFGTLALFGLLFGASTYGAAISLAHVLTNLIASWRDILVTWLFVSLLYGGGAAAVFVASGLAVTLWRRFRRAPEPGAGGWLRSSVFLGFFLFNVAFWVVFGLFGLTYDQVPFGRPSGPWSMLGFLAGATLAIALLTYAFSRGLLRLLVPPAGRPRTGLFLLLLVFSLAIHLAVPFHARSGAEALRALQAPAGEPPRVEVSPTGLKVILVGLDGADWQVVRPLMEKGQLPAFSGMVAEGSSGPLHTLHDSNSAVIWASIYTGREPRFHSVADFYRIHLPGMASDGIFPVHRTYFKEIAGYFEKVGLVHLALVDRFTLTALPLWEILDHLGISYGVVDGYFYSFPAMKPSAPESYFLSYGLDDIAARRVEGAAHPEFFIQPKELYREVRPSLAGEDFGWQSAALLQLLASRPQPRFLNLYTHQPDTFQHWYWKWFQPQYFFGSNPEDQKRYGDLIPQLYRDFDGFLGQLDSRLGVGAGSETVVIVASDHGHSPTLLHSGYYTQHRHGPPGILLMEGGPVRPGAKLDKAHVYDLYPTILYLLGLPVPEDAAGRVLTEALDPAFVQAHPIRTIPTYQTLGPARGLPGKSGRGSDLDAKELEKLRSLGYL